MKNDNLSIRVLIFLCFSFFIVEAQMVNISVYNVVGELVEVLANSFYKAGTHQLEMQVSHIEAGSYLYTMRAGEY